MDPLTEIQKWYHSQCDGEWEHSFGIKIQNIDNPGWMVQVELSGTALENIEFPEIKADLENKTGNWLFCKRTGNEFQGCGGPHKLAEILEIFLKWAHENEGKTG